MPAGHVGRFSRCKILAPSRAQQPHEGHLCSRWNSPQQAGTQGSLPQLSRRIALCTETDPTQPVVKIKINYKHLHNICHRTGILLINAAGVVIRWGILSCPPIFWYVYAISIVVIEECQKYFIKRSAVIPRTPL